MTIGEVALAKAYDNAPTVDNADQADSDHDGVGDVIEGATLTAPASTVVGRNQPSTLTATLRNGAAEALAGQTVTFAFDADGDAVDENYVGTTDASGVAQATVTATRAVGPASYSASWDGLRATAEANGTAVSVKEATALALDDAVATRKTRALATATLTHAGAPLAGRLITFAVEQKVKGKVTFVEFGTDVTDASGIAQIEVPARYVSTAPKQITATFAGGADYFTSSATAFAYRG